MSQLELFEKLLDDALKINSSNRKDFDLINQRAKLYVRKFFGENSHYIHDINSISYSPRVIVSGAKSDNRPYFEAGLDKFRKLVQIIIEDIKLSTNYPSLSADKESANKEIDAEVSVSVPLLQNSEVVVNPGKRFARDGNAIQVLLASPSDVSEERERMLNSLETKFRREGFENQCGKRIIVRGWEELASQSGYGQDIINGQILSQVDIVLAVFKHKLGTPTIDPNTLSQRGRSGTAEELLYAINNSTVANPPLGMAYFYSEAPKVSLDSLDFEKMVADWKALKEFKQTIRHKILYKEYSSVDELLMLACQDLSSNIKNHFE